MVVILIIVSFLVFSLLALSPGSVVATLLGTQPSTPQVVAAIKAQYHLNDPFLVQYWHWLTSAVHGDLGRSIQSGEAVTSVIASHLPVTLELAAYTLVLVVVVGIPVGMAAGIGRGRLFDRSVSGATIVGMGAPGFALGILLIYVFGVGLGWFPVYGAGSSQAIDRVYHLTLPAVALATGLVALIVRQTRAAVMDVMEQDYITFARTRGVGRARVMLGYALRNTALPVVTAAGLLLIVAISGTVLVETVFSLPGAGQLMVQAIEAKNVPVVQGLAFFVAVLVVAVNLLVDAAALMIDPRTRAGVRG
ncbi:ABC transporter permease [Leekyejoonella antrihumi]|uniref:ABC transporter permease n=2 Tax=Leekyejoonella antrihumi TaxID=1660198 RepID=A0A563DVG3_9MICO|nr:ABC transporter permease [Leekyejoonella antrihumi]